MTSETHIHVYEGRSINLRLATEADLPILYRWRADPNDLHLLSADPSTELYADFVHVIGGLLSSGHIVIVEQESDCEPIGYALTYSIDAWNGTACAALYLVHEKRLAGHVVELAMVTGESLFAHLPLRKLFFEVYESAEALLRHMKSVGYEVECFTPKHFRHGNEHEGLWTLSVTRESRTVSDVRRDRILRWIGRRAEILLPPQELAQEAE